LAVLPVLLFHAKLGCPGGFVGVDIFFVISGFLISSLILKELREDSFSLVTFWERRIRRIMPALTVVVLATFIAGCVLLLPEDLAQLGKSIVAQVALLSNVYFYRQGLAGSGYFAPAPLPKPLLHTWSLAVEEQFYLLFPLILMFLPRFGRFSLAKIIAILAAGSFGLSVYGSYFHQQATFYLLPARAWELALGAALALTSGRLAAGETVKELGGWLGLILIACSIFGYDGKTRFPGMAAVPPCLGAALIILSSESKLSGTGKLLAAKPLVFIGLISYSLYLWHWPVLVFSKYWADKEPGVIVRIGLLVVSVLLAALTWKFVETPCRSRRILAQRRQIFGLAGLSTVALLLLGLAAFFGHGIPSRLPQQARAFLASRNHFAFRDQISVDSALAGQFVPLGARNTNQPVELLVWGDSHAMAVAPVLNELCCQHSWRGELAAFHATAPVLGYSSSIIVTTQQGTDQARTAIYGLQERSIAVANAVLKFIAQNHVKNVVIASHWSIFEPTELFKDQLLATVRAVVASGARVFVLRDVPTPGFDVPRFAALAAFRHGDLDQLAVPPDEEQTRGLKLSKTFDQLSRMAGVTVLDPAPYFLNSRGRYAVVKDNQALYFDADHLTVEGSRILAPLFEPIFHTATP